MLKGIDISYYQPNVNFPLLKTQIDFVIIRSSYGVGYIDKSFSSHQANIRQNGFLCGYYHYSYPQYNQPEDEADWFLQVIGALQDGEVLFLDFEEKYNGNRVEWCKRFLDRIAQNLNGYKGFIYLNKSLASGNDWSPVINAGYGLWLAAYDNDSVNLNFSSQWPVVHFKQYTDAGTVPGISTKVDCNIFWSDASSFRALGYRRAVLPQPVPTPLPVPVQPVPQPVEPVPVTPKQPTSENNTPTFLNSLKSRKLILAVGSSITVFLNSIFNMGINMNELIIIIIPVLAFIITEGLADIFGRSKK